MEVIGKLNGSDRNLNRRLISKINVLMNVLEGANLLTNAMFRGLEQFQRPQDDSTVLTTKTTQRVRRRPRAT